MEQSKFYQIKNITEQEYTLVGCDGSVITRPIQDVDKSASAFTIQDAKDGDVLCCESGWTCLFKALDNHTNTFSSYCFMDSDKWFCDTGSEGHTLNKEFMKAYNGKIKPATKEQRNTFFTKMKEAGYEWDADKKELKKIKQNPSWSEEDEMNISIIIEILHYVEKTSSIEPISLYSKKISWLKSLKDRVQSQPKQEWSDVDKGILFRTIDSLKFLKDTISTDPNYAVNIIDIEREITWLKSLRPQNTWKPSEEQMDALEDAITDAISSIQKNMLNSLYSDLKKL